MHQTDGKTAYSASIFKSGLWLVLIPGSLGVAFLVTMSFVWNSTAQLTVLQQKKSEIIIEVGKYFSLLKAYSYEIMESTMFPVPGSQVKRKLDKAQVDESLARLRQIGNELSAGDGDEKKLLQDVIDQAVGLSADVEKLVPDLSIAFDEKTKKLAPKPASEQFVSDFDQFMNLKRMLFKGLGFADSVSRLIDLETENQIGRESQVKALRRALKMLCILGVAGGIIVAAAVLLCFVYGILLKLRLLKRNASNFQELLLTNKESKKLDEFGYLDRAFRLSAEALRKATMERQELMQMLAHDMRSPIMSIQINVEILQEIHKHKFSQEALMLCEKIKLSMSRIHELVSDLLAAEKLKSSMIALTPSTFLVSQIVEEVYQSVFAFAESQKVKLEIAEEFPDIEVHLDKERLQHALMNILHYSIRTSKAGQTIRLNVSATHEEIRLAVLDEGFLPSALEQKSMFDPWESDLSDVTNKNLNLGLWVCRLIVEAHGGDLGIVGKESQRQFWCSFPARLPEKVAVKADTVIDSASNSIEQPSFGQLMQSPIMLNCCRVFVVAVLLQAFCLFWVNNRLDVSANIAKMASQETNIVSGTTRLWANVFKADLLTLLYTTANDEKVRKLATDDIRRAVSEVSSLDGLVEVREGASDNKIWKDARAFVVEDLRSLRDILASHFNMDAHIEQVSISQQIMKAGEVSAPMQALLTQRHGKISDMLHEQERLKIGLEWLLYCAIAGNLLFSLWLLWVFSNDISKRIDKLVEMASKLPEHIEITDKLEGKDEISEIYWHLHRVSNNLNEAYRQRKEIMTVLAKDIGKPLVETRKDYERLIHLLPSKNSKNNAQSLEAIKENSRRVLDLVNDLLVVDKLEEGRLQLECTSFNLQEIIDSAKTTVSSLAQRKDIKIVDRCDEDTIEADKERLIQVLVNLITNAIKFSPKETVITVEGRRDKDVVVLTISDQGPGIEADQLQNIFQRFFQSKTEQKKQGFGLGLAICKLIVDSHDGEISVKSESGKGTTFTVVVPVAPLTKTDNGA